jgi:hypothetical protein
MISIEPLIDAIIASCFLFAATFYIMVAYSERGSLAWKLFGASGAIWFSILFIKLVSNMSGWPWITGIVRSVIAVSLVIYLCGLFMLARMLR